MKSTNLIPFIVNERACLAPAGSTVLQACEYVGITIPRFCYHERLSIAGNCRMCLVQLDKALKPIASCAMEISPGMKVFTNSSMVKKAREGVMEFLLANHPLDCPICDQGGECDLQDQSLVFGNDRGRFYETKRSVTDKNWGSFIKTVMTRCIHCTRCQRFSTELSGSQEIAMVGRGNSSEITNFISVPVQSEVSGNVIDLCPVGALTSKPYAFTARPWELRKIASLDLTDSMGSNLSFHVSGQRILRVLPILNQELNQEWASDRARFHYDGYRLQRLVTPLLASTTSIEKITWGSVYTNLLFNVGPFFQVNTLFGEVSLESTLAFKRLLSFFLNSDLLSIDDRGLYSFTGGYSSINEADLVVIVGLNLRRELPLLLIRLREEQNKRNLIVFTFGSDDNKLSAFNIGSTNEFVKFLSGKSEISTTWAKSRNPVLILSNSLGNDILVRVRACLSASNKSSAFNVVTTAGFSAQNCAEVGLGTEMNSPACNTTLVLNSLVPIKKKESSLFYFGSNGFQVPSEAEIFMIPIAPSTEIDSFHLNGECRLQKTSTITKVGNKNAFDILRFVNQSLLVRPDRTETEDLGVISDLAFNLVPSSTTKLFDTQLYSLTLENVPFSAPVSSVYLTTPVTHSSSLLVKTSLTEENFLINSFLSV